MDFENIEAGDKLDELSLTDLWRVIRRVEQYSSYFRECEGITTLKSGNYGDRPYQQQWFLKKAIKNQQENILDLNENAEWTMTLTYQEVRNNEAEHDYSETVSVGKRTAYKLHRGHPIKISFAPLRCRIGHGAEARPQWGSDVISPIIAKCDYLDAIQGKLEDWVKSGLGMQVRCRSCALRSDGHITNAQLSGYLARKWSVSDLQDKLTCKGCRQRRPIILPTSPNRPISPFEIEHL